MKCWLRSTTSELAAAPVAADLAPAGWAAAALELLAALTPATGALELALAVLEVRHEWPSASLRGAACTCEREPELAGTATWRTGIDRARCSNLSTADRTAGRAGKCAGGGGALVGGGHVTAISEGAAAGGGAEAGDAGAELEKAPLREETIIPPLAFKRAHFDRSAGAAEVAAGSAAAIGNWADAEAEEAAPSLVAKRGVNKSSSTRLSVAGATSTCA